MKTPRPYPVLRVGQIWEDNDKRMTVRRQLRIVEVLQNGAIIENIATGRQTAVLLNRFRPTSTWYRLVSEPQADDAVARSGEQVTGDVGA